MDNNNFKNDQLTLPRRDGMLRVAIIEDSLNISRRLKELVEAIPGAIVVGQATTEMSAVKLCNLENPDVILLDLQLESGTGLGFLRAMQYLKKNIKPKIIVLTNFPSNFMERAAIVLGADRLLDKSLELHKLVPLLKAMTAG